MYNLCILFDLFIRHVDRSRIIKFQLWSNLIFQDCQISSNCSTILSSFNISRMTNSPDSSTAMKLHPFRPIPFNQIWLMSAISISVIITSRRYLVIFFEAWVDSLNCKLLAQAFVHLTLILFFMLAILSQDLFNHCLKPCLRKDQIFRLRGWTATI